MTMQPGSTRVGASGGTGGGRAAPMIVLAVLAFIVNAGVYYLQTKGIKVSVPINLIGGFSLQVNLSPALESLILAWALWVYSGLSFGAAIIAAIVLFVVRMLVTFGWGYLMSKVMPILPLSLLTQSTAFYGPLFLQVLVTGASVLVVLVVYEPAFRAWWPWILTLAIWAGGTTGMFVLYHDQDITRAVYPWLVYLTRAAGFLVIGYEFGRPQRLYR